MATKAQSFCCDQLFPDPSQAWGSEGQHNRILTAQTLSGPGPLSRWKGFAWSVGTGRGRRGSLSLKGGEKRNGLAALPTCVDTSEPLWVAR